MVLVCDKCGTLVEVYTVDLKMKEHGTTHHIDLCRSCYKKLIGEWFKK